MTLQELEELVVYTFSELNVSQLHLLDPGCTYSDLDKNQIIDEISKEINRIREKGIIELDAKPSKCKFCYPSGSAFSFHNTSTGTCLTRYVIYQEDKTRYIIERCRNRILSDGEEGLPF